MKKLFALFLGIFVISNASSAGIIDFFSQPGEDQSLTFDDIYGKDKVETVVIDRQTVVEEYNVPFYVKEQPFGIPQVKTPPVLWGGSDLYYPYQLEEHLAKKNYQTQMNAQPFSQRAQNVTVVCRKAGCTRLNDKVTRQFLYNNLLNLFLNNKFSKVNFCEADPYTRACLSDSIRFGGRVGGTASLVQIYSAYMADIRFNNQQNKLDSYLMYDLFVNGNKAQCAGALTSVEAYSTDQVVMRDNSYKCSLTSGVPTSVFSTYLIDYIDLDYGIIGAWYSLGLSGESAAGGNGYMLMKFFKDGSQSSFKGDAEGVPGYQVPAGEYEVSPVK